MLKLMLKNPEKHGGLTELIPGHIYKNKSGKELLFLGYGELGYDDQDNMVLTGITWTGYCFFDWKYVQNKIKKGFMDPDLSVLTDQNVLLLNMFQMSSRLQPLTEDLGEKFPDEKFNMFTMQQSLNMGIGDIASKMLFVPKFGPCSAGMYTNI